ncbi:MAG: bacterial transcriptional activator domain-containing protein [Chloroflexota bacterium]
MGAFQLSDGAIPVVLPGGSQRLIAFLALKGRPMARAAAAGALWPDGSEEQAHASLRSAIWRLDKITRDAMQVNVLELDLAPGVGLDLRESRALAHRLLIVDTLPSAADMSSEAIEALTSDLLPDWYDEWVVIEAEDWRQLRLHALEALAGKLSDADRFGDAVQAARAAIQADPLRESAHASLIRVHLAEGNQSEALHAYEDYCALPQRELGLAPTGRIASLVQAIQPGGPRSAPQTGQQNSA